MSSIASRPIASGFRTQDGCLVVGGIPLGRLAERVGQTPFFAYDRRLLDERVAHLRQHLPQKLRLHYAMKANPMPALVQHLAHSVDGFDVASAGELKVALDTPMDPRRISLAGPGKTDSELAQAVAAAIVVSIESRGEMKRLAETAERLGLRPRVLVRVNPDFEVKGSGMRMGGGPQQFGIDSEEVPDALRELRQLDLEFLGFHIFAGSQNLRSELLMASQERVIELAIRLSSDAPSPVRHLNMGGGFGIRYFAQDVPLDIRPIGENLDRLLERRLTPALPDAEVITELGRYIVGEAGVYVARIVDRKISRGQVFLITDGGLHHQLAASGNFGQVMRRNYPVAIGNRIEAPCSESVNIVGCLCTPIDLLADKVMLPRAEVGDFVAIFQAGAYGLTASPTLFLSHPPPIEVVV